jgi:hypothetical protein
MIMHYDREGKPLDSRTWMMRHNDEKYVRVAYDKIGRCEVSTVWIGIDYSFGRGKVPLIFETLAYGPDGSSHQHRYGTEAEALAGHAQVVASMTRAQARAH